MASFRKILMSLPMILLLTACAAVPEKRAASGFWTPVKTNCILEDAAILSAVFFETNRSDLNENALTILRQQQAWLSQYPNITVTIEGHADERGTREYNLALGERRAAAVRNFFIASGIDGGRIKIVSYGKEKPAVSGADEVAWAKNRRSVSVVDN